MVKNHNAGIHLRMGVQPWQEGMDPVLQFDRARTACNKLRGNYRRQVVIYDAAMGQREERDQLLLNDFGRALENHEFEVYYQPKYDIQSELPTLTSAEALVRWRHLRPSSRKACLARRPRANREHAIPKDDGGVCPAACLCKAVPIHPSFSRMQRSLCVTIVSRKRRVNDPGGEAFAYGREPG